MLSGEFITVVYAVFNIAVAGIGWYLVFGKDTHHMITDFWYKNLVKSKGKKDGIIDGWVRQSLSTVTGKSTNPQTLYTISGIIFILIFSILIGYLSPIYVLFASLAGGGVPFIALYLRLESLRKKGSHEGEILISEFLRQYRITGGNIYETLEKVVNAPGKIKVSRKLLFKLLLELRSSGDLVRIRQSTDAFAYGMNTNWGQMLAQNIYIAATSGTDISIGVEDILIQLRDASTLAEERKRLNSESVKMTLFMVPFTYIATVVMAIRYLDTPFTSFIKNQLGTGQGLSMFLTIIFLFILNILTITFINNQKFDF